MQSFKYWRKAIIPAVIGLCATVGAAGRAGADDATVHPNEILTNDEIRPRIVGGEIAPEQAWPWQIRIFYQVDGRGFSCGGSLVAPRWVLTAAHCVANEKGQMLNPSGFFIFSGSKAPVRNGEVASDAHVSRVRRVVQHPGYSGDLNRGLVNDIALLELTDNAMGQPVALADGTNDAPLTRAGNRLTVTGWGLTKSGGQTSDQLRQVELPVVGNRECGIRWDNKVTDKQICVGATGTKDSCQGDSGGPLVAQVGGGERIVSKFGSPYVQVGVVSWGGAQCATKGNPSVYTRVAAYRDWIDRAVGRAAEQPPGGGGSGGGGTPPGDTGRAKVQMLPGNKPHLRELISMSVTSSVDGYVMLVDIDPSNTLNELLPNDFTPNNPYARIMAGQTITIPAAGAKYQFRVTGATGRGALVAIVVSSPTVFQSLKSSGRISVEKAETPSGKGNEIVEGWLAILERTSGGWAVGRQEYEVLP